VARHPSKILGQAGKSLPDVYDVEGSQVEVNQLEVDTIKAVHEMGSTIFSERVGGQLHRLDSGTKSENETWDIVRSDTASSIFRIWGAVIIASGVRVTLAQISLHDPVLGREIPLSVFDSAVDSDRLIRTLDDGGAIASFALLQSNTAIGNMPSMGFGPDQAPLSTGNLAFRGLTSGFGAGTVDVTALVYIGHTQQIGLTPYGVPIPGW